jgi:hypothetical protein
MSKEVKRYNFDVDKFGSPRAYESEHGRWMKRADYDALLAENESLRGLYKMHQQTETREMRDLRAERDALLAERDAMRRDAERWRPLSAPGQIKAGDWLSFTVVGEFKCARVKEVLRPGSDREEVSGIGERTSISSRAWHWTAAAPTSAS